MNRRPIALDLFAGAGGMSLGFEQAGFDVVAAVEIDPVHAATYAFNSPQTKVIARSVVGLSARQIRDEAKIGDSVVHVVFGGPPCQGFSLIGHRILDDPRNRLVGEFLRIVSELDSHYFVFENVKGLTIGNHRQFLLRLIAEAESLGYKILQPWKVLNSRNYDVPQDRERLFLIGAKKSLPLPQYPKSQTGEIEDLFETLSLPQIPTCRDALDDLPDADEYPELLASDCVYLDCWPDPSEYARDLRCIEEKYWHYAYLRLWEPGLLTSSLRTLHTEISQRRFEATPQGEVEPISRFFRLRADGQSNTLRAGTDSARGAFTSPRPIHYRYPRCITVREMARLHGYPDWFRFHVTKWHGARQVGNSVPPPLARAVAARIMDAIGIRPTRPKKRIALGSPDLLSMDMTAAANYWGVDVPIARRDRRSGARKRKQQDVEKCKVSVRG